MSENGTRIVVRIYIIGNTTSASGRPAASQKCNVHECLFLRQLIWEEKCMMWLRTLENPPEKLEGSLRTSRDLYLLSTTMEPLFIFLQSSSIQALRTTAPQRQPISTRHPDFLTLRFPAILEPD